MLTYIQANGEALLRVDPCRCSVELDLTLTDAHAIGTKVTKPTEAQSFNSK
jgi:hypothetical protein